LRFGAAGDGLAALAEPPPPTPREPSEDETVVANDWPTRPESQNVVVEHTETVPPRRRLPEIWPWLLALLVLVLAGLAAAYFITRDDDEPASTTTAPTASTTTATTDTTAALVSVPDVVGTTSSEATATLRDAGFEANVVAVPSDRPSGQVVAQNPAAGTESPEGSTVRLNVAQAPPATTAPPEPATVPEVVGDELADAAKAFGDEGLKVAVQYVPSSEPQGRVVAQAQPAGTERERGDTVQVNVSTGPEPAPAVEVPNVAGAEEKEARKSLERAGFEVLDVEFEGNRPGVVISQSPKGGASIPRGSLVILYGGE
jgi:serine/threonine-protein kinase